MPRLKNAEEEFANIKSTNRFRVSLGGQWSIFTNSPRQEPPDLRTCCPTWKSYLTLNCINSFLFKSKYSGGALFWIFPNSTPKDPFLHDFRASKDFKCQKNDDVLDVWNRGNVFSNGNYKSFERFIVFEFITSKRKFSPTQFWKC